MTFMAFKNIGLAMRTIRASRSRSFFTVLGVVIAVASVTTIVSIGNGIKMSVAQQATRYSKDVVTVRPAALGGSSSVFSALRTNTAAAAITTKDVNAISKVAHVVDSVPLTIVGSSAHADGNFNGIIFAASSDLPDVLNQQMAYGAFYSSKEDSNNVAVLGATAAERLFDQRVPLGRSFDIGSQQFIVNGVLSPFAATPFTSDANFNNAIFVPAAATKLLTPNGATIYQVLAKVDASKNLAAADAGITRELHKTHQGQADVGVYTPTELAQQSTGAFDLISYLVLAASIITLIVSGVGIMNVMLVSVTERIHEIGIRKAVGATNRQIRNQFMTEAATLSVVGSLFGAFVALIICLFLRYFSPLVPRYDWRVAGLACLAACLFGILFGTVPALKAARKDPIAALRNE